MKRFALFTKRNLTLPCREIFYTKVSIWQERAGGEQIGGLAKRFARGVGDDSRPCMRRRPPITRRTSYGYARTNSVSIRSAVTVISS